MYQPVWLIDAYQSVSAESLYIKKILVFHISHIWKRHDVNFSDHTGDTEGLSLLNNLGLERNKKIKINQSINLQNIGMTLDRSCLAQACSQAKTRCLIQPYK